jgi:SAM-dependent methyltransferase
LLIVGCGAGIELRHLEIKPHFDRLIVSGTNIDDRFIYKRESYDELYVGDFVHCPPKIPSNLFDIIVCEQVLEHLTTIDATIAILDRALKPGGRLIIGVPIFPPPLHLLRKHMIPKLDRLFAPRKSRGHLQAFSLSSFLREMRAHTSLKLLRMRGFRVVSGGLLRGLENYRWWWKFNRRIGELMPGLCIEVQVILEKPLQRGGEWRTALAAAPAAGTALPRPGE